ncbi:PEP-CTERM sorting domain-containing protein [Schlesneria sp. T3-172]
MKPLAQVTPSYLFTAECALALPEPSTLAIAGLGGTMLTVASWRRRQSIA